MQSDDLREQAFRYARRALRVRRLVQCLGREPDRKAMEAYAIELSKRALALMASASMPPSKNGHGLVLRSLETLKASKPRYP